MSVDFRQICSVCLKEAKKLKNITRFVTKEKSYISHYNKLITCIPEMMFDDDMLIGDIKICNVCVVNLDETFLFRNICLSNRPNFMKIYNETLRRSRLEAEDDPEIVTVPDEEPKRTKFTSEEMAFIRLNKLRNPDFSRRALIFEKSELKIPYAERLLLLNSVKLDSIGKENDEKVDPMLKTNIDPLKINDCSLDIEVDPLTITNRLEVDPLKITDRSINTEIDPLKIVGDGDRSSKRKITTDSGFSCKSLKSSRDDNRIVTMNEDVEDNIEVTLLTVDDEKKKTARNVFNYEEPKSCVISHQPNFEPVRSPQEKLVKIYKQTVQQPEKVSQPSDSNRSSGKVSSDKSSDKILIPSSSHQPANPSQLTYQNEFEMLVKKKQYKKFPKVNYFNIDPSNGKKLVIIQKQNFCNSNKRLYANPKDTRLCNPSERLCSNNQKDKTLVIKNIYRKNDDKELPMVSDDIRFETVLVDDKFEPLPDVCCTKKTSDTKIVSDVKNAVFNSKKNSDSDVIIVPDGKKKAVSDLKKNVVINKMVVSDVKKNVSGTKMIVSESKKNVASDTKTNVVPNTIDRVPDVLNVTSVTKTLVNDTKIIASDMTIPSNTESNSVTNTVSNATDLKNIKISDLRKIKVSDLTKVKASDLKNIRISKFRTKPSDLQTSRVSDVKTNAASDFRTEKKDLTTIAVSDSKTDLKTSRAFDPRPVELKANVFNTKTVLKTNVSNYKLNTFDLKTIPDFMINQEDATVSKKNYLCHVCEVVFNDPVKFMEHMKQHPRSVSYEKFKCITCNLVFKTCTELNRHGMWHMRTDSVLINLNENKNEKVLNIETVSKTDFAGTGGRTLSNEGVCGSVVDLTGDVKMEIKEETILGYDDFMS